MEKNEKIEGEVVVEINKEVVEEETVAVTVEEDTSEIEEETEAKEEETKEEEVVVPKKELKTVESLEKELGEMKDKYLRIFAEFDNYRKRTSKEKIDIIKLASKDAINALLPAVDDFSRAIKVAEENEKEVAIPEGIVHVYNKLMKGLEQQGVRLMESTGTDFDSELHEALTKIPAPTEELKGKVIDTIEQGYYLNDKIIRYAKVVVGE